MIKRKRFVVPVESVWKIAAHFAEHDCLRDDRYMYIFTPDTFYISLVPGGEKLLTYIYINQF